MSTDGAANSGSRAKLSSAIADIDQELQQVEQELRSLRRRKQELQDRKRDMLCRIESNSTENSTERNDQWDCDGFPWSQEASEILQKTFRLQSFRLLQRAAINAVMSKEDAVIIMSTGGGKSLCYQLPAILSKGLTLVVSPLISLIEDQLSQLRKLGIECSTLNHATSAAETKSIDAAITSRSSNFRLLYVTPEKLAKSKRIMNKLEKSVEVGFLKLIAVDEVHCCSQWGHDFRPDYKFLNVLKRQFKGVPLLGLTATATARVLDDVKEMLGIPAALVFRAGFNRSNLFYEVRRKTADIDSDVSDIILKRFAGQSGIVYCISRKDCEQVAKRLREQGVRAAFYHAYLENADRSKVHERWTEGKIQVIVATIAFGMGIDKADVRFVIHYSLPKSVDNYYQESGRAGRDGAAARCILFFGLADVYRQSTMVCSEKTGIQNLYNMVRFASDLSSCRRVALAEHFEEAWETDWCQKSCDVCESGSSAGQVDIDDDIKMAEEIIQEQKTQAKGDSSGRITGGKLVELMSKKGFQDKYYYESVVCHCLLEGFLQEDFHFTPYSIISYVEIGMKWRSGVHKGPVLMTSLSEGEKSVDNEKPKKKKRKILVESDSDGDVIVL